MRIIDSHLHLFNLSQGDYHWLNIDQPPYWHGKSALVRDYGESDLQLPPGLQLAGFVHIEAGFDNRQPWREIAWLEQHCQLPFRSVGYADLTSDNFVHTVEQQLDYTSLVGIRNIVANDALNMLKNPRTAGYLDFLVEHNLILELQLDLQYSEALTTLLWLADRWSTLTIVLNHAGLATAVCPKWCAAIQALAERPNCIVKCSGWEMQQPDWSMQAISPVIAFLLETLPVSRLMLASNFPVSELSCSYAELWQRYAEQLGGLLPAELFFDTAWQVYGFDEL
ncbi:amidohydrolase family protein [Neptuniibacter sp. CAU 1671]|uniref:amidohydrolase family protein n=1 Tax=Neptuniibacter sp. CAU 1671 TaxID=3032593 RepID=UPI0023DA31A6|nr:amidohydrolase family protein [Neptuniibacter sp. CAU 1671]MDF2183044.1 amidohydrolase family protein [Neptuniibacter sp. CAU 1671]